jgi:DNA-binding transcriptional regulator YiaG
VTRREDLEQLRELTIPERVRFLRKRRRNDRGRELSHDSYAALLGTKRGRVIAWEKPQGDRRHSEISELYARKIADLEDLPVEMFKAGSEDEPLVTRVQALEQQIRSLEGAVGTLRSELQRFRASLPAGSASAQ